jgi:hypothetical protein
VLQLFVVLTTMLTGHESLRLFLQGYLKDCVYYTNPHTIQELQVEVEAVVEEITGDMLHNTVDSFVVYLQGGHKAKGLHMKTTHVHKISMKVIFRSCIMLLYPGKLQIYHTAKLLRVFLNNLYICIRSQCLPSPLLSCGS